MWSSYFDENCVCVGFLDVLPHMQDWGTTSLEFMNPSPCNVSESRAHWPSLCNHYYFVVFRAAIYHVIGIGFFSLCISVQCASVMQ